MVFELIIPIELNYTNFLIWPIDNLCNSVPVGLVVRIRRSHRRGRGSIPRLGDIFDYRTRLQGIFFFLRVYCSFTSVGLHHRHTHITHSRENVIHTQSRLWWMIDDWWHGLLMKDDRCCVVAVSHCPSSLWHQGSLSLFEWQWSQWRTGSFNGHPQS